MSHSTGEGGVNLYPWYGLKKVQSAELDSFTCLLSPIHGTPPWDPALFFLFCPGVLVNVFIRFVSRPFCKRDQK